MSSLRRLCAVLGVIGIVVITLAGNQPDQATGAVGLLRLRLGSVSGSEDYIFTAGNVVYPDGITVDAGTFYKIVVTDGTGATRNGSFACTPAANVGTTNNTYTIKSTDPVSTSAAWTFNVQQYTTSACSGTPTKASKSFYVAAATSYADTGLTTAKSLFKAGDSAYVTVSGLKPGQKNWSVTWVQPNGTTTCANTAGSDRPDSGSSGKLPPAPNYVKYAPDATSTNAWNKLANYDPGSSCPAFASTNDGAWQMKLQFDATDFVTVPVFTVDATPPPVPTIASGPASPTAATTASFSFSDTESGATFLCSLDGAAFAACSSPASYTGLSSASHTFRVEAVDAAGNVSAPASATWTVDTVAPPAPTISTKPPNPSNQPTAAFSFSDTEAGVTFNCRLDAAAPTVCTSPQNYSALADGSHTFQVTASDAVGNTSPAASYTWVVDTVAPAPPTLTGTPANPSTQTTATFTFTGEAGATFRCSLDAAPATTCTSPQSYSSLAAGSHSFSVTATDVAGNTSSATTYGWTVSLPPAQPSIDSHPPALSNLVDSSFGFSDTSPGVTFLCSLDGSPFTTCASPVVYHALADGSHTFQVEATNGLTSSSPASFTWTNDLTPPAAPTLTGTPANPSNQTSATFSFTDEAGATFACRLDGAAPTACSSPQTYSALAAGAHTFQVTATDAAGNTSSATSFSWTISIPPPQPTIDSHPAVLTNQAGATLAFSDTASGITFLCSLDGASFASCTSPVVYAGLADGSHTFQVEATDGITPSTPASFTWTIDTTAPAAPTLTSTPPDPSTQTTAAFSFTDEAGAAFRCSLDGAAATACTSPQSYPGLAGGSHTFQVTATDAAGNTSPPASYTWTISIPPPQPSIDSHPAAVSNQSGATFAFSDTKPGVTFVCSLDAAPFTTCASPVVYSGVADGSHTFQVEATDGITASTAASFTWTIDTVAPPAPTFTAAPPNPSSQTSAHFAFGDAEGGVSFACSLDGAAASACTSPQDFSGLAAGSHTFQVTATDAAGNTSAPASDTWTIALPPPVPSIDSHPAALTTQAAGTFTFSDTDASAGFACSLDGAPFAVCSSPLVTNALADGSHTFQVEATGVLGVASSPASFTWTIDTTAPPAPSFTATPANPSNQTTAHFTFTDAESGVSFACSLDGTTPSTCTSPQDFSGLVVGSHTFNVTASDAAGNASSAATYTWTIVVPPPQPTINSHPSALTNQADASFTFSDTDPTAGFACSLDGAPFTVCASPLVYHALADGSHTFQVEATNGGLTPSTPASFTWTIDTTAPPAPTLTATPATLTNQTTAHFTFTDGESGVSFACRLDGATASTCASPQDYTGLAAGAHTFAVTAKDAAGNTSSATNFAWTIDTTPPPAPTLSSTPPSTSNSSSASFSFSDTDTTATLSCSLDGGAATTCTSPKSYTGLADGSHTFRVTATDAAGNASTAASYTWTIDTTPPPVPTLTSQPAATTNLTAASFGFSDTEAGATFTCSLDGAAAAGCTSPQSYSGLAQGSHTFQVRAADALGNTSAATSYTWTVDTTPPPTPSITGKPANPTNQTSASFTFSDTESGVSFACSLDGGASAGCTSPKAYSGLAAGSHTFQVTATDAAGNISTATSYTWTIDTTAPPAPSISSGPSNPTTSTTATFAFSDTESGVSFTCSLDNAAFSACTSPTTYSSLAAIAHTFQVKATDAAGNSSAATSYPWTITASGGSTYTSVAFADAFESGTLNAWGPNGGDGTASVLAAAAHTGSYGLRLSNTGTQYDIIAATLPSPVTDSQTSFAVRVTTSVGAQEIAEARDATNSHVMWSLFYDGGNKAFWFYPFKPGGTSTEIFTGTNTAPLGSWINVTVQYTATSTGGAKLFINGTTQAAWGVSGNYSNTFNLQSLQLWNDSANAVDIDEVKVATPPTQPAGLPGAPTGVSASAGNGNALVSWNAPSNDGGGITGYRVTPYIGGVAQTPVETGFPATSYLVPGLTNGTTYTFTVAAESASGRGPESTASPPVKPAVPNAIQTENTLQGDPNWGNITNPTDPTLISGYGSQISINHGQSIDFYVTTTAASVSIDVYRMGWYNGAGARLVKSMGSFPGVNQPQALPDSTYGMVSENWTKTATLTTSSTWTTGVYLARLSASNGYGAFIFFVVRDDGGHEAIEMQTSVDTYQAYNVYGGTSLYNNQHPAGASYSAPHAMKVSYDRPFLNGSGTGDFLRWEYPFIRWAEKNGYDMTYTTDVDTHTNVNPITNHKAFLVVGHDEYWSKGMRDNVEAAIAAGVNVGFFAGNESYWQVRFEPNAAGVANRVMVGYKDFADCTCPPGPDPQWNVNNSVLTALFRNSAVNRPEEKMMGAMYGGETNNSDFIVQNSSNWVYAGTGWTDGTHVPGLVGYEYDHYYGDANTPPGTVVLSNTPLTNTENNQPDTANATIYTAPSGAIVFEASTIQWSWGLDAFGGGTSFLSPGIQRVTSNILGRFTGG